MAVVAGLALGHLCQERFFFELAFVDLCQSLARAQDQVDKKATDEEDRDQQGGGDLKRQVLRARANVAERPDDQAYPEDDC